MKGVKMIEKHKGRLGLQVMVLDEEITVSIADLNGSLFRPGGGTVNLESLPRWSQRPVIRLTFVVHGLSHPSFVEILLSHLHVLRQIKENGKNGTGFDKNVLLAFFDQLIGRNSITLEGRVQIEQIKESVGFRRRPWRGTMVDLKLTL